MSKLHQTAPFPKDTLPDVIDQGMSLRDYFAGQALIAITQAVVIGWKTEKAAAYAYQMADAMLEEREDGKK